MKTVAILFAAVLLVVAVDVPVMAESFYAAFDAGRSTAEGVCNNASVPAGSTFAGCRETGHMYRIAGGYKFARMWGAEIGYGEYGNSSMGIANIPGNGKLHLGDWKLSGLEVSGTGAFPITERLAILAKAGLARTMLKFTPSCRSVIGNNFAYGIGAEFAFNGRFAIRAQYENLGKVGNANSAGKVKVSMFSAGIVLGF
ncbi:MAG: outer membrane beta-barrel protein [Nitrosomonadales bacterium]|nr:outer membrane beta-barrel protein [Nitrosomonadales bacterium]